MPGLHGGPRRCDAARTQDRCLDGGRRTATISSFTGRRFEHKEEACWREGPTAIGFHSDTYGDADAIEIDVSDLDRCRIRLQEIIDGYVEVGNPLDGNPFVHCPSFDWEISGAELFLAIERMNESEMPRDVQGTIDVDAVNGPYGFRPIYFLGRQIDEAKVWTSALFMLVEEPDRLRDGVATERIAEFARAHDLDDRRLDLGPLRVHPFFKAGPLSSSRAGR
ncbi:MAG: hypothetical protein ABI277_11090 [Burkholderiaceae bacterium]